MKYFYKIYEADGKYWRTVKLSPQEATKFRKFKSFRNLKFIRNKQKPLKRKVVKINRGFPFS